MPMPSYGMIRVSVRDRDPAGIVEPGEEYERVCDEIIEALTDYRDPLDGQPVFERVLRARDIYEGPHTSGAPDLVAMRSSTRFHTFSPISIDEKILTAFKPPLVPRDPTYTGTHSPEGIFVASGPGLSAGEKTGELHLRDFAPTILAALGLPVPGYMDGCVIKKAFEDGFFGDDEPRYTDDQVVPDMSKDESGTYNEEESEAVQQRLRDLGYF